MRSRSIGRRSKPVIMVSRFGGMDIEEVSEKHPESIAKFYVDTAIGYSPFIGRELAFAAHSIPGYHRSFPDPRLALRVFFRYGAKLVEINPLAFTAGGPRRCVRCEGRTRRRRPLPQAGVQRVAQGAAAGRRRIARRAGGRRHSQLPPLSRKVGTMANGAGLAMATMDAVSNAGGQIANFLDVGGGANAERVRNCYELVVNTPAPRSFSSISSAASRAVTKSRAASCKRWNERRREKFRS